MGFNISVLQEPRGVMRILHFIFSICAFGTITGYGGTYKCACNNLTDSGEFSYPFMFDNTCTLNTTTKCIINIAGYASSDAKFFVATGVLAMLYAIAIMIFLITVVFGVLWLSSSAAWANSLTGLKSTTNPDISGSECKGCTLTVGSFSTLDISVIFGFLNFFLWAADLWFVYKETEWFPGNQQHTTTDGV
ncbi:hypothetical protein NQ317_011193 [Molorchus minor]|uniref:MARVEL domain-containing protein n=1 Tax=Molorchus minor TaxID=1323400 RepID=A0ABQ9IWD7_9CUCU|nr:hypothetical protein NQ317_011193 [Molorchus minor]